MAVTFYSSEDAGAIQTSYSGPYGAYQTNIIDILDSILIDGYGSKPGLGWTKLMTSEVAGSDRTVYSNQSAYEANCMLLVESNTDSRGYFKLQIADTVISPELFSGYSNVGMVFTQSRRWMAVGDERTLILIFYVSNMYSVGYSSFNTYAPQFAYIGDFDRQSNITHKGWGMIAPTMKSGAIDLVISNGTTSGFLYSGLIQYDGYDTKVCRPVTQLPGEDWSESSVYCCLTSFMPKPGTTNASGNGGMTGMATTTEVFEQQAQIRMPWFFILNRIYVYKLRGIFNIYPSLLHCNSSGLANMLKPLTIDGINYIGTKHGHGTSKELPMTAYIQTSGDW